MVKRGSIKPKHQFLPLTVSVMVVEGIGHCDLGSAVRQNECEGYGHMSQAASFNHTLRQAWYLKREGQPNLQTCEFQIVILAISMTSFPT